MELSYAAYNPIANNEAVEGLPGDFRESPFNNDEWTAEADLISKGFQATPYNYGGISSVAAHTIGHRPIEIGVSETINNTTGGEENVGSNTGNIDGIISTNSLLSRTSVGSNSRLADSSLRYSGNVLETSLTNETLSQEADDNTHRQLIVVAIRGSVTIFDWVMNFLTQGHLKFYEFEDGADDVIETLCGYEGCTECTVEDENCDCRGYLNNINNPIILVTGHSLGAVVANLVAAKLNEKVN